MPAPSAPLGMSRGDSARREGEGKAGGDGAATQCHILSEDRGSRRATYSTEPRQRRVEEPRFPHHHHHHHRARASPRPPLPPCRAPARARQLERRDEAAARVARPPRRFLPDTMRMPEGAQPGARGTKFDQYHKVGGLGLSRPRGRARVSAMSATLRVGDARARRWWWVVMVPRRGHSALRARARARRAGGGGARGARLLPLPPHARARARALAGRGDDPHAGLQQRPVSARRCSI